MDGMEISQEEGTAYFIYVSRPTLAMHGLNKRFDGWNGNMSGGKGFALSVVDISEHMYM